MTPYNGLRYSKNLELGFPEMGWLQAELAIHRARRDVGSLFSPGWVASWAGDGQPDAGWEVYETGGALAIRAVAAASNRLRANVPYIGVDPNGQVLELPTGGLLDSAGAPITVPNDGVWRTLVASYLLETREPGTLTLTASSTSVTGVGTAFTRYTQAPPTEVRTTRIRIDATDSPLGNAGAYDIASIASDGSLTLASPPPVTEAGVFFRIQGQFLTTPPANPDVHYCARTSWELRTRTTTAPTDGLIAYDVRRSGGTLTLLPRVHASVARPVDGRTRSYSASLALVVDHSPSPADLVDALRFEVYQTSQPDESVTEVCVTGADAGDWSGYGVSMKTALLAGILVENSNTGTDRFMVMQESPWNVFNVPASDPGDRWHNPAAGVEVDVVSATGLRGIGLLAIPRLANGNTHLGFYIDSTGKLQLKTCVDDGVTWVGPTAIWSPTAGAELHALDAILTRLGLIVVVAIFKPAAGDREIRYITSADYGVTWSTNTNAGTTILHTVGGDLGHPKIVEDSVGNLWISFINDANEGRVLRGAGVNNPVPDASVPVGGWQVGSSPGTILDTSLLAAPDGANLLVFYTNDAIGSFGVQNVSRGHVVSDRRMAIVANTAPGHYPIRAHMRHDGTGMLLIYHPGEFLVRAYELDIGATERPHGFRGGY